MKKLVLLLLICCFSFQFAFLSLSASFEKSGEYYRYFNDDGSVAYDQIIEWERKKYYVNDNGYAVFNSWVEKDGKYYYAGNDGAFYTNGVKTIGGDKFYFNSEGEMQKGWCGEYLYYGSDEDGCLVNGFQELEVPKDWPTEESNEKIAWFYFDTSTNKRVFSENNPYICKQIGSLKYCFDQNGIIRTGWRQIKETTPVMKGYMYFVEESSDEFKFGQAVVDSWYAVEPPVAVLPTSEVRYFYFNGQGQPRTAPVGKKSKVRMNEKTYLFNEYGYAVYGIHVVDNNYYYFGPSVSDCSMKTGIINADIDGSNDGASYYFQDDGIGYTGVHKDKLYYKGKLQMAGTEQKYAAIEVDNLVRLVNTSGVVMKNKKKVKDGDGCAWSTGSGGVVTYRDPEGDDTPAVPPELSGDN